MWYIEKELGDGFTSDNFNLELNIKGVKNILLMGCNASLCVWATAQSAVERGYSIATSTDFISDSNSLRRSKYNFYDKSLNWYRKYCQVFV